MSKSLHEFQLSSWVLVGFCKVQWGKYRKFLCSPIFCAFHGICNFSMIGLYQGWATTSPPILFKHYSYRPEIWWEDAQYHEAPRYSNGYAQVMFACQPNFEIFHGWLGTGRCIILGNVRKSHHCLKFGSIMQCTMKQITVSILWCSRPRVLSCSERRVPFVKNVGCE